MVHALSPVDPSMVVMARLRFRPHLLVSVLGAALGAVPARAQVADPVASASGTPAWCASVAPGTMARVTTAAPGSRIGPVVHCDGTAIVLGEALGQDAPEYTVPTMFLRAVWTRRTGGRLGLVLGAASGGAVGGVLAGL